MFRPKKPNVRFPKKVRFKKFFLIWAGLFVWLSLNPPCGSEARSPSVIRYVALGDSYTIGTGALPGESWPQAVVAMLRDQGIPIELTDNLARAGWTSRQVIEYQLPVFAKLNPTFTTILVGANDISREVDVRDFAVALKILLNRVQEVLPDKSKILLLTVPDFSVTPRGKLFGADTQKRIMLFNLVIRREALSRGLKVVDLFVISQLMGRDAALVAADGLHPSAKAYAKWARLIYPDVYEILK